MAKPVLTNRFDAYETVRVATWDDLVRGLDKLAVGWTFRGQGDARWPLRTTLERFTPPGHIAQVSEDLLVGSFVRSARNYLASHEQPDDERGEWIALMQHFGAPTRLLDVTRSPYVAAYFAVEQIADDAEECAVWAFDGHWRTEAAGAAWLAANRLSDADKQGLDRLRQTSGFHKQFSLESLTGMLRVPRAYSKEFQDGRLPPLVLPYLPERLTQRLTVQQGEFLVQTDMSMSFERNLAAMKRPKPRITKFTLPASARGRALSQLRLMNITRATLFPGLDGFAQSFRQLLFTESPEDREKRGAFPDLRANTVSDSAE